MFILNDTEFFCFFERGRNKAISGRFLLSEHMQKKHTHFKYNTYFPDPLTSKINILTNTYHISKNKCKNQMFTKNEFVGSIFFFFSFLKMN